MVELPTWIFVMSRNELTLYITTASMSTYVALHLDLDLDGLLGRQIRKSLIILQSYFTSCVIFIGGTNIIITGFWPHNQNPWL